MRRGILRRLREDLETLDEAFSQLVERLKLREPRSTIILIGSRARGTPKPCSDYDVILILDEADPLRVAEEAYKLKPRQLPLDLLVIERSELGDPLRMRMLEEGCIVLHDGLGIAEGLPCQRPAETRSSTSSTL